MKIALLALAPLIAWTTSELLKLLISAVRAGQLRFTLGQYGGMPSTHTTIVTTGVFLVGHLAGFESAAFAVACGLAFVTIIDAAVWRRQIAAQAAAINRLLKDAPDFKPLRERVWHSPAEIAAGLVLGTLLGTGLSALYVAL